MLEGSKARQNALRAPKKFFVDRAYRHPENSLEFAGDTVSLFCFRDFVNTKGYHANLSMKASSRGNVISPPQKNTASSLSCERFGGMSRNERFWAVLDKLHNDNDTVDLTQ